MVQYNIGSVWALNSLLLQRVWSHSQCSSSFVYLITPYTNWHSPKTRSAITHVMTFFSCPTLIWLGNIIIIIIIIIVIRWKILSGEGLRRARESESESSGIHGMSVRVCMCHRRRQMDLVAIWRRIPFKYIHIHLYRYSYIMLYINIFYPISFFMMNK